MRNNVCLLCKGKFPSKIVSKKSIFTCDLDIIYCEDCELYFLNKILTQEFLDKYYADDYFDGAKKDAISYLLKSWFSKMRAFSQVKYILSHLEKKPSSLSVLEIGSSDGVLLSIFKNMGWKVRGLEYNLFMIKHSKDKYNLDLESKHIYDLLPSDEKFDLIAFPHVLEHMPDPIKVLTHAKKLLNPGGIIFIELPHSPQIGDTSEIELSDFLKTEHLFDFRPKSIISLLKESNLRTKCMDRFFYHVPEIFSRWKHFTGKTLLQGKPPDYNLLSSIVLFLTLLNINLRFLLKLNPMKKVKDDDTWQGPGDNIRIISCF